jgi:segregation and condensation protein B
MEPDRQPETFEQELSLDALTQAFAEVLHGRSAIGPPPSESAGEGLSVGAEVPPDSALDLPESTGGDLPDLGRDQAGDSDSCELSPRTVFEAMLFVGVPGDQPLTAARAAELMRGVEPGEIPAMVDDLNGRYRATGCPYHVVQEGAGYRLTLRAEFEPLRAKFYGRIREARLSQAAVDVLAIVAYRQPVSAEDVSILRDTPSGAILSQLVRRQLLRMERTEEKPRKTLYSTTDRFLKLFGLETLADLPQSEDLEGR